MILKNPSKTDNGNGPRVIPINVRTEKLKSNLEYDLMLIFYKINGNFITILLLNTSSLHGRHFGLI